MDLSHPIDPGVYVIPRNHELYSLVTAKKYLDKYSFICIGQESDGMFALFD